MITQQIKNISDILIPEPPLLKRSHLTKIQNNNIEKSSIIFNNSLFNNLKLHIKINNIIKDYKQQVLKYLNVVIYDKYLCTSIIDYIDISDMFDTSILFEKFNTSKMSITINHIFNLFMNEKYLDIQNIEKYKRSIDMESVTYTIHYEKHRIKRTELKLINFALKTIENLSKININRDPIFCWLKEILRIMWSPIAYH